MERVKRVLAFAFVAAMAVAAALSVPAAGNGNDHTIVAVNFQFRLTNATGTPSPTITVHAGESLHLRIENHDATFHSFTVPHFGIDRALDNGSASQPTVIFVNITTTSADVGTWQFWCRPHSSGSTPETHTGMIGRIVVEAAPTTPPTPGFEALGAILAIMVAAGIVAVAVRVRKR